MSVMNRIGKIRKRNTALVAFDRKLIVRAIMRAATSAGGFDQDHIEGTNDSIVKAGQGDEGIAEILSDLVVVCLNSDEMHLVPNSPPSIELIQDTVLHVLRSYGFMRTADAYECYRWGQHWKRMGALSEDQFVGTGYPKSLMNPLSEWNDKHGCSSVEGLNDIVLSNRAPRLIEAAIAEYEKHVDEAAQAVFDRLDSGDDIQMIWICGPSSSGKTTTTVKLTDRLASRGLEFLMLNIDDYFWAVSEHPTDWIDDRNYETPAAIDIHLLNQHLHALLAGETIEKPVYSFKERKPIGTVKVSKSDDQILLLDCLHGLYPPITEGIDPASIFRVYIEAMNPIDEPNPQIQLYEGRMLDRRLTRFEDIRLLRRTLRDTKHRNHPPLKTLLHWHYVRAGELFSIIPLRGMADCVLNGGMPFDLPALKSFFSGSESILPSVKEVNEYPTYLDALIRHRRISSLLEKIEGFSIEQVADTSFIPGDAVVREFVGGSTIKIPHND